MNDRDRIYVGILSVALSQLQNLAIPRYVAYCAAEVDHIHNIPSLIGETNENRHAYYLEAERSLYLERIDRSVPGIQYVLGRYAEFWKQLEAIA